MMKVSFERISKYPDCCKSGALTFKRALGNKEVFAHQVVGNPIPINDSIWFMSKELPIKVLVDITAYCTRLVYAEMFEYGSLGNIIDKATTDTLFVSLYGTKLHRMITNHVNTTQKQNKSWLCLAIINQFIYAQHLAATSNWEDTDNNRKRLYDCIIACTTYIELMPEYRSALLEYLKKLLMTYPNKE